MQKITSVAELKFAIRILEDEQAVKGRLLKEQFNLTFESLNPINLLKRSIADNSFNPQLVNNIIGTFVGLLSGSLSNKVFVGSSGNVFKKLFGTFLQYGVTNIIAKNPDTVKTIRQYIFHYLRRRRESRLKYSD